MKVRETVKIDFDYINAYLHRNRFTASEFSKHLGYSSNWWSVLKSQKKYTVPKATAEKICDHFGFDMTDIVLEEYEAKTEQKEQPQKHTDLDEFARILQNIDEKLAYIEQRLEKLKWLEK